MTVSTKGNETAKADDRVVTSVSPSAEQEFQVFISYHMASDQSIANALKDLIESALDPRPKVFVSGGGGIRPSSIGFRPQLQAAIRTASAFVAIITQKSKEREWIFYEAGAAWGRDQLYAPLLIDTSSGDLPSTIAGYQATRALDRTAVEHLITQIAFAVNAKMLDRFGHRFRAFAKRVESYLNSSDDDELISDRSELSRAIDQLKKGEVEEASQLFNKLEAEAKDNEYKAKIRCSSIVNQDLPNHEILTKLERIEHDLLETATCQYELGTHNNRPTAATVHYKKCIDIASALDGGDAQSLCNRARIQIATEHFRAGRISESRNTLREGLASDDRSLRLRCAKSWEELHRDLEPNQHERLAITCAGLLDDPESVDLIAALARATFSTLWNDVKLYAHSVANEKIGSGTTSNNLGIALHSSGLKSLAYLSYTEAMDKGVSVARVNIANYFKQGPLPGAGLALLQDHTGDYDALNPALPYKTRGELEELVAKERLESNKRIDRGRVLATMIGEFGWNATRSNCEFGDLQQEILLSGNTINLQSTDDGQVTMTMPDGKEVTFDYVGDTVRFLVATLGDQTFFLCRPAHETVLLLAADLKNGATEPSLSSHHLHTLDQVAKPEEENYDDESVDKPDQDEHVDPPRGAIARVSPK